MSDSPSAVDAPDVSIVIPFYGDPAPTLALIQQLRAQEGASVQIIVADDASPTAFPPTDGVDLVRRTENGGFGRAVNAGAERAVADRLLILNSDLEVGPAFVADLLRAAEPFMPAVTGCVLAEPGGSAAYTARRFPRPRHHLVEWLTPLARFRSTSWWHRGVGHDLQARPGVVRLTDWLVGAVLLLPTATFRSVGGFDPRFHMNSEEIDLQKRLSMLGVPAVYIGTVQCLHEGGGSSDPGKRRRWLMDGRLIYADKWGGPSAVRSLQLALGAASVANLAVNGLRRLRGSEVQPILTFRQELSLLTLPASRR